VETSKAGLRQMMPSVFNGIATAIAAAAGLIGLLHQTGYLGNNHPRLRAGLAARAHAHPRMPDQSEPLAAADTPAVSSVSRIAPSPAPAPVAAAPNAHHARVLSGAWRDMGANCHLIAQSGHDLTVTSYAADTGQLKSVGSGTIKGRTISMRMNTANPASLEADLVLSEDGREMSGILKGRKGAHIAKWHFLGPSCSELASRPASTN
jgi:hypothetical protein